MQVKPTRRRWRGHVIDATQRVILSSLSLCILWSSNLLYLFDLWFRGL
jgi:hypothetical protein